jgi:Recombinase
VRLVVEPRQAETVRLIFELYATGFSLKRIAKKLNAERVESPRPQIGRISRSWCPSSMRAYKTRASHHDSKEGEGWTAAGTWDLLGSAGMVVPGEGIAPRVLAVEFRIKIAA